MKKLFLILSILLIVFSLASCNTGKDDVQGGDANNVDETPSVKPEPERPPETAISEDGYWVIYGEKTHYAVCTCETTEKYGIIAKVIESNCCIYKVLQKCTACKKYLYAEKAPVVEHNYVNFVCEVCGEEYVSLDLEFTLNDDGTAYTVTGVGTCRSQNIAIPDTYNGLPVTAIGDKAFYNSSSTANSPPRRVLVGANVTSIGEAAFAYMNLIEITLPSGLETIGINAFRNCTFKEIDLPDSITSIGDGAFAGCENLKTMKLPSGISTISDLMMCACSSLTSVEIPSTVTSIGARAFQACTSLESISIPDGVLIIDNLAFDGCSSLKSIRFPSKLEKIPYGAFASCTALEAITIPEGIKNIDERAFENCTALKSVKLPQSLESIGDFAFYGDSSLSEIKIPPTVTAIGVGVFRNCSDLKAIAVDNNNAHYKAEDGVLYTKDGTVLIAYPAAKSDNYFAIPGGVTRIESYSFQAAQNLAKIIVSDSVQVIGTSAFAASQSLENVLFGSGVTLIEGSAFSNCPSLWHVKLNEGLDTIGSSAFSHCQSLKEINLPESLTKIGMYAFSYCASLTSVIIPDAVKAIGSYVFATCRSLNSVVIGSGVSTIDETAFQNSHISTVYYKRDSTGGIRIESREINLATRYYYSETEPTEEGKFWHYDENNNIAVWEQ